MFSALHRAAMSNESLLPEHITSQPGQSPGTLGLHETSRVALS